MGEMICIGVGHRARQGKSLFCSVIVEQCSRVGISCGEYSISDAILRYSIANGLLPEGLTREACSQEQVKILVDIGNEGRRKGDTFWTDIIHTAIVNDAPKVALIPNVRFESEADLVHELGGVNVCVTRYNENGSRYIDAGRNPNDSTEIALEFFSWDFRFSNMPSKPYWLRYQAIAFLDYLRDGGE